MIGQSAQPKVWRGDLAAVYLDPLVGPADTLAWIQEQHASPRCERAAKRGSRNHPADPAGLWCDACTVEDPADATVRWDGRSWVAA